MSRIKIILLIVFIVIIIYVVALVVWEKKLITNSSFDYRDAGGKIHSINNVDVNFKLIFSNESHLGFTIESGNLDVYLDGHYVTKVDKFNKLAINANSANEIPIAFNINPAAIYKQDILPNIAALGQMKVTIKGPLKVRKGLVYFNYPVDETFTLNELMS